MVPLKTACRRDVLYWLAVSFTFALATAAGDLTAGQLHFGFVGSIVLFAIVTAVPALGCWRFHFNSVLAFWWAYITTRPLGASVADWVSKWFVSRTVSSPRHRRRSSTARSKTP